VIGAINAQTREGREYSPDEIELLSIIADVLAGELEKAIRRNDELQKAVADNWAGARHATISQMWYSANRSADSRTPAVSHILADDYALAAA
jgi:GAF domain-containing protein